jgi:hypothetical protein
MVARMTVARMTVAREPVSGLPAAAEALAFAFRVVADDDGGSAGDEDHGEECGGDQQCVHCRSLSGFRWLRVKVDGGGGD